MPDEERQLAPETIQRLQRTLLSAVLRGEPLPGGELPIAFPDLAFVLRPPAVLLSEENLAGPHSVDGAPLPIRVLSPEALAAETAERGEIAYLRFQPAERRGDAIHLTLEAKIASSDSALQPLGLGGVQASFRRAGDEWVVDEPPAAYAT